MADELSINATISFSKGGAKVNRSESASVTVTGDSFIHNVQSIDTSEEVVLEGTDLGTPGYMWIKNLDATNYVDVGLTGAYQVRLKAGEIALYRVASSAAIYALANTGACLVEYVLIET